MFVNVPLVVVVHYTANHGALLYIDVGLSKLLVLADRAISRAFKMWNRAKDLAPRFLLKTFETFQCLRSPQNIEDQREMFKIEWDKETGGILLTSKVTKATLGISPRPVWFEELDLLGLDKLGWNYPRCEAPLLWAVNKQYYYRGQLMFEAKGANIYDAPTIVFAPGFVTDFTLDPVDVEEMLHRNKDQMFLLESEAIEFIRDTYTAYSGVNRAHDTIKGNQVVDFEALAQRAEKRTKTKMAVVKEDCDSFDIVPLEVAKEEGKRVVLSTRIDRFIASFSGGKDSQVVLDLVTRAIPPSDFEVIYSDTGYELPPSLQLYEDIKRYYTERFPALKFSTARNHESVLNYWDQIGTPSDTHRWCCSVMKTAPLYRSLKIEGTNKQARVLTFDGVRSEESVRRSSYNRIGKGKHVSTYNAHPIFNWNAVEIYLYMFIKELPINIAYRQGFSRVGCVICPFGSDWSDYLVSCHYSQERAPFLDKLKYWVEASGVKDTQAYLKTRRWHISALGSPQLKDLERVFISQSQSKISLVVLTKQSDFFEWLKIIGPYSIRKKGDSFNGDIQVGKAVYSFNGGFSANKLTITFVTQDKSFINNIIRVAHKAAYCVRCEVCEVECPTGALHIVPKLAIGEQCVHCLKCISWHEKGCIAADCLRKISGKIKMDSTLSIKGYKTFGLRDEWVDEYMRDVDGFWSTTLLGSAMFDSFKTWGKDIGILDPKNRITEFGKLLQIIYLETPSLFWEVVWVNLTYSSFIVNRFVEAVKPGQTYDKKSLVETISLKESVSSITTLKNAAGALIDLMKTSPIGDELLQGEESGKLRERISYNDLSLEALAYSLYVYGEKYETREFRVSDLYNSKGYKSAPLEFGITKSELLKKLRALSADSDRVLIAELNMGLDHITLRDGITSFDVLKMMTE